MRRIRIYIYIDIYIFISFFYIILHYILLYQKKHVIHFITLYYIILHYIRLCYIMFYYVVTYVILCFIDFYTFGNATDTRSNFLVAGLRRFVLKNCSGNGTRLNDQLLQASETLFLCFRNLLFSLIFVLKPGYMRNVQLYIMIILCHHQNLQKNSIFVGF